jgi:nitrate/nitrite transporter NarK
MALLVLALAAAWIACVNFGAIFQLAASTVAPHALGSFFGFVNFIANLGAVLFTLIFGLAKDLAGAFYWGFGGLAVCAIAAYLLGRKVLESDCAGDSCRAPDIG